LHQTGWLQPRNLSRRGSTGNQKSKGVKVDIHSGTPQTARAGLNTRSPREWKEEGREAMPLLLILRLWPGAWHHGQALQPRTMSNKKKGMKPV